jgi:hypothetical protein
LLFIAAAVGTLSIVSQLFGKGVRGERGPWQAEAMLRTPVGYLVGATAAFWVVQRVVAFWA